MSHGKKSKGRKNHRAAKPPKNSGDKDPSTHMDISGRIEVSRAPSLEEQHKAERREDTAEGKKRYLVEKLTLAVVIVYAGLTAYQAYLTRSLVITADRTFNAANRPYVGVGDISIIYGWKDSTGVQQKSKVPITGKTNWLGFQVEVKNFGPIPGTNFQDGMKMFVDGLEQPSSPKVPDLPATIFPGQPLYLSGVIGLQDYPSIVTTRDKALLIEVTIEYEGPSGHYKECESEQYSPLTNAFFKLGPKCTH